MLPQQPLELISDTLPLLPVKDIVIFPQVIVPIFISEEICIRAVEEACAKDHFILLSTFQVPMLFEKPAQQELKSSTPSPFDVYDVGTVATVLRTRKLADGRVKVLVQGVARAEIKKLVSSEPFPMVQVQVHAEKPFQMNQEGEYLFRSLKEQLGKCIRLGRGLSADILVLFEDVNDMGRFSDLIASQLGLKIVDAQKILASYDAIDRSYKVYHHLCELLKITKQDHHMEHDPSRDESEDLKNKILQAHMPTDVQNECLKQFAKLSRMNPESSEASLARNYLELMADLPWSKSTESKIEMAQCQRILDEDHYGMEKIKDRILEYLAVKKLNPELKGPVLCFVGPPGVGKTSLGKSVARALGRKFARIALGGVHDEAEIRGHRRTYVGAMPGRIIQALKTTGVRNPVLMLDEIDKLASNYKGDPASALLEVLDPEQNHGFSDHYVSMPFDLSQVIFLANANQIENVPHALRDRLEIVEIPGYSEEEKIEIARKYIIPKVIKQSGLSVDEIQFQETAIDFLITAYTRESGLRNLEKIIASVVRKIAREVAENDEKMKERKSVKVTTKLVRELLGDENYLPTEHDVHQKRIGVSTGLAYTQVGGDILELEVKLLPGSGRLILTGQLGDVMKESAQTALNCVHAMAHDLGIDEACFKECDIHFHAPAGGIPKDGPSAGIAIAMALVSAFKQEPLRQDIAMTGELTLHGRVLPIGGVREKLLAAVRHHIHIVCLPEKNKSAFSELPASLKRKIDVRFVSTLEDVLKQFFGEHEIQLQSQVQGSSGLEAEGADGKLVELTEVGI